ncbi:MAG: ABC transporter ATP-binding protein [Pseudomonadales bacterium]
MSTVLQLENICKSFGQGRKKTEALKSIDLQVSEGEVCGFIGGNGAGKSTTIKIILDLVRPDRGVVTLYGQDSASPNSRRGLAYLPEKATANGLLTPLEILRLNLSLHDIKRTDEISHCMNWLDRFGIASVASKRIGGFSKGMMQRTLLAQCFAVEPRMLILDEPLSGLDPQGRRLVVDLLQEFRSAGGTMLFTSHVLHDVESVADRVVVIDQGEIIANRSCQSLWHEGDKFVLMVWSAKPLESYQAKTGDYYQREINRAELGAEITRLENLGAVIVSAQPVQNLESMFFSSTEKKASDGTQ